MDTRALQRGNHLRLYKTCSMRVVEQGPGPSQKVVCGKGRRPGRRSHCIDRSGTRFPVLRRSPCSPIGLRCNEKAMNARRSLRLLVVTLVLTLRAACGSPPRLRRPHESSQSAATAAADVGAESGGTAETAAGGPARRSTVCEPRGAPGRRDRSGSRLYPADRPRIGRRSCDGFRQRSAGKVMKRTEDDYCEPAS